MIDGVQTMDRSGASPSSLPDYVLEATLDAWGQAGERHTISISGHSMVPAIHDGDRVLVAHGCAGVRRGDVVVFRLDGLLIAHRVLHVKDGADGKKFVTKGDNAGQVDPHVSPREIVGQVLAIERDGQHISLQTFPWRALGWLIAVGTLAWMRLYRLSRALKQRLLGPQPNRVTAGLRRDALAFFSRILRLAHSIVCWWTGVRDPSCGEHGRAAKG
jgi:signal peptidase I